MISGVIGCDRRASVSRNPATGRYVFDMQHKTFHGDDGRARGRHHRLVLVAASVARRAAGCPMTPASGGGVSALDVLSPQWSAESAAAMVTQPGWQGAVAEVHVTAASGENWILVWRGLATGRLDNSFGSGRPRRDSTLARWPWQRHPVGHAAAGGRQDRRCCTCNSDTGNSDFLCVVRHLTDGSPSDTVFWD